MIQVGNEVVSKRNPNCVPCKVLEIKDLGHGKGYERVKIQLPLLKLIRYYALNELMESYIMPKKDDRTYTYFEIECPSETEEKAKRLIGDMTFEEFIDKIEKLMEAANA